MLHQVCANLHTLEQDSQYSSSIILVKPVCWGSKISTSTYSTSMVVTQCKPSLQCDYSWADRQKTKDSTEKHERVTFHQQL